MIYLNISLKIIFSGFEMNSKIGTASQTADPQEPRIICLVSYDGSFPSRWRIEDKLNWKLECMADSKVGHAL